MQFIQTFILHLYVDPDKLERLCGDVRTLEERTTIFTVPAAGAQISPTCNSRSQEQPLRSKSTSSSWMKIQ